MLRSVVRVIPYCVVMLFVMNCALVCSAEEPPVLVVAGTVTKISGSDVTVAALNEPKFVRTFRLVAATQILRRNQKVDKSALEIDLVIMAKLVRGQAGYDAERVDVLGKKKP